MRGHRIGPSCETSDKPRPRGLRPSLGVKVPGEGFGKVGMKIKVNNVLSNAIQQGLKEGVATINRKRKESDKLTDYDQAELANAVWRAVCDYVDFKSE